MTQTKANQTEIKKTEIKTDFCKSIAERRNLAIRQQVAQEYVHKCKRKRIAKAKRKERIKEKIVLYILYLILIGAIFVKISDITSNANETEKTNYEVTNEEPSRVYAIGKLCEVVEINESENIVTVECNGEKYDFYGDGYFVGQTILCKFTEKMELVDVIE